MRVMQQVLSKLEAKFRKRRVPQVKSGDIVRVHQRVKEGSKIRTQVFEGMVIRTDRMRSATARITVRRISSGVGVEKSFLLHSPNVLQVEIIKRSKVRRNYLSYMRSRQGKAARLAGIDFDVEGVNLTIEQQQEMELADSTADKVEQNTAPQNESVPDKAAEGKTAKSTAKNKSVGVDSAKGESKDAKAASARQKKTDQENGADGKGNQAEK